MDEPVKDDSGGSEALGVLDFVAAEEGPVADEQKATGQIDLHVSLQIAQVFVGAVVGEHQLLLCVEIGRQ